MTPPTPSPCTSLCTLNDTGTYCLGCLRTVHEIMAWASATEIEKQAIIAAIAARKAPRAKTP